MPKVPKRKQGIIKIPAKPKPMPVKEFVDELYKLRSACRELMNSVNKLESVIYYRGISDPGPIVDTNDDVPF